MPDLRLATGVPVGTPWRLRLTACLVVLLYAVSMLVVLRAMAQDKPTGPTVPAIPAGLQDLVRQQFGECFQVAMQRSDLTVKYLHPQAGPTWRPFLTADLDGDGVEDAVIVARCATPMGDAGGYDYKVIDPYFTNYGYGDARLTSQFNAGDPNRQNLILIIQGAGKDAWRAAQPKAKYVIVNAPFDSLGLTKVQRKKKQVVPAINLVETEGQVSAIFWDGKKWQWQDGANGL